MNKMREVPTGFLFRESSKRLRKYLYSRCKIYHYKNSLFSGLILANSIWKQTLPTFIFLVNKSVSRAKLYIFRHESPLFQNPEYMDKFEKKKHYLFFAFPHVLRSLEHFYFCVGEKIAIFMPPLCKANFVKLVNLNPLNLFLNVFSMILSHPMYMANHFKFTLIFLFFFVLFL